MDVARKHEATRLQALLLEMCGTSPLIQREPGNALARFLFSSMLASESAADGDELHDPLLPTGVTHDVSMCRDLQKVNVSTDEAHRICEALCLAGREAVTRLDEGRARGEQERAVGRRSGGLRREIHCALGGRV